jgi:hypothetical protein
VTERGSHVGVAQHAGKLPRPGLARDDLYVARRDPAAGPLCHHQVMIGVRPDLGEMRDHEGLPAPRRCLRHRRERLPHASTYLTPDALVHLVEYERRDCVVLRQNDLQRQHQARELAS